MDTTNRPLGVALLEDVTPEFLETEINRTRAYLGELEAEMRHRMNRDRGIAQDTALEGKLTPPRAFGDFGGHANGPTGEPRGPRSSDESREEGGAIAS